MLLRVVSKLLDIRNVDLVIELVEEDLVQLVVLEPVAEEELDVPM